MKNAILTLSLASLLAFGTAAWAGENFDTTAFAGIPGIELGARLNSEPKGKVQPTSEKASETAVTTRQAPNERKVRIVYPLPR